MNKFGRLAAGYVVKKSEKLEELEYKRRKEAMKYSPTLLKKREQEAKEINKSDIEIQMEKEKSR